MIIVSLPRSIAISDFKCGFSFFSNRSNGLFVLPSKMTQFENPRTECLGTVIPSFMSS